MHAAFTRWVIISFIIDVIKVILELNYLNNTFTEVFMNEHDLIATFAYYIVRNFVLL